MEEKNMGKKQKQQKVKRKNQKEWIDILPFILLFTVHPLTVIGKKVSVYLNSYPWFPDTEYQYDFFMYGKMIVFMILVIWEITILTDRCLIRREKLLLDKKWIVLGVYGLLVILAAAFSIDKSLSVKGMWEQYETVWTLLGYLITAFAALQIIRSQNQVQSLAGALCVGAGIQAAIGLFQTAGLDFWNSSVGKSLISLGMGENSVSFQSTDSGSGSVYMSLYNPNYAGVYILLVLPFVIAMIWVMKEKWQKLATMVIAIALIVCLFGCGSKTGIAVLVVTGILFAISRLRGRQRILVLLAGTGLAAGIFVVSWIAGGEYYQKNLTESVTKVEKYKFQDLHAEDQKIYFRYEDQEVWLDVSEKNGELILTAFDQTGKELPAEWDVEKLCYRVQQEPFQQFEFTVSAVQGIYMLCMNKKGVDWNFAKKGLDGAWGYVTQFGKIDEIKEADAVGKGHERALSGRGYIWGRTIPLLPGHLLIGTGPDTFIEAFPQNDYVKRYNTSARMLREIPSKAHSLYLQSAVQTGVMSVICLILFWVCYLKESICLYWKHNNQNYIGMVCCVSVGSYLIMGIMNDSNLATAPVFWGILGLGMAANQIQKECLVK